MFTLCNAGIYRDRAYHNSIRINNWGISPDNPGILSYTSISIHLVVFSLYAFDYYPLFVSTIQHRIIIPAITAIDTICLMMSIQLLLFFLLISIVLLLFFLLIFFISLLDNCIIILIPFVIVYQFNIHWFIFSDI